MMAQLISLGMVLIGCISYMVGGECIAAAWFVAAEITFAIIAILGVDKV